jgi:outer membrane lipopolysaccharide assembly protein LptE/RlpB
MVTISPVVIWRKIPFRDVVKTSVSVGVFLMLSACGYHFKAGLSAPRGVDTVAVPVLENRTWETGIETVFTNDLLYEFTRSKVLSIADRATADAVLEGTIVSLDVDTVSHTVDFDAYERRVIVTLAFTLTNRDGTVIWSCPSLVDREEYKVLSEKLKTEEARLSAIEIVSQRTAEKVHNGILQDF